MARALNKLSVSKIKANLLNIAQSSLYKMTIPIPTAVRSTLNLNDGDYENINLFNTKSCYIVTGSANEIYRKKIVKYIDN